MTKKELIEKLSEYPDDMLILVDGYESGFDDVKDIYPIEAVLVQPEPEKSSWFSGRYEKIEILELYDELKKIVNPKQRCAVVITSDEY